MGRKTARSMGPSLILRMSSGENHPCSFSGFRAKVDHRGWVLRQPLQIPNEAWVMGPFFRRSFKDLPAGFLVLIAPKGETPLQSAFGRFTGRNLPQVQAIPPPEKKEIGLVGIPSGLREKRPS